MWVDSSLRRIRDPVISVCATESREGIRNSTKHCHLATPVFSRCHTCGAISRHGREGCSRDSSSVARRHISVSPRSLTIRKQSYEKRESRARTHILSPVRSCMVPGLLWLTSSELPTIWSPFPALSSSENRVTLNDAHGAAARVTKGRASSIVNFVIFSTRIIISDQH